MGGREIARGGGLLDTPDPIFDTFWHFGGGGGGWGGPIRVTDTVFRFLVSDGGDILNDEITY